MLGIAEVPVRAWLDRCAEARLSAGRQRDCLHAAWDKALLKVELADLRDQAVDLELMGFSAQDALGHDDRTPDDLPQALQLEPPRQYALIMCANEHE